MARGIYGPWANIDLDAQGRQVGMLNVPVASTRSAMQNIRVPLITVRGGDGPTILVTGGVHGDEYEGQVALCRLIRTLGPDDLTGGVVMMPAANLPAALAATRVSPWDDGNLNNSFPGRADGGPTEQIAHFIETELLPNVGAWIDIHSGGTSMDYTPLAAIHSSEDPDLDERAVAALKAFGAPLSMVFRFQNEHAASSAAQRHGKVYIYGEFGGSGTVNPDGVDIAFRGIIRCLDHFGVLRSAKRFDLPPLGETPILETVTGTDYVDTRRNYVFSPCAGVFEPVRSLNETVREGQVLGYIHDIERPLEAPREACFDMDGVLIMKRHPARVEAGDFIAQLAIERP
jgi:uncharacterized protein